MTSRSRSSRPGQAARASAAAARCHREANALADLPLRPGDWSSARDRRARLQRLRAEAVRLEGLAAQLRGAPIEDALPF